MSDRRAFLKFSVLSTAMLAAGKKLLANSPDAKHPLPVKVKGHPVVISTWDFGQEANEAAWQVLKDGGRALDAVEAGVKVPEADPENQTVGIGGRPDRDGRVTLDACIMDENSRCGAVACLENVVHAISVARMVMEKTPHVMLAGDGATQFALANGFKKENLLTEKSKKEWQEWMKEAKYEPWMNVENEHYIRDKNHKPGDERNHDTIGMLSMDTKGNMSGACTTSGLAFKMHGRVGDSPIIGAGLYVDNEIGAATSSGVGEEVVRIVGSHLVVELMRQGMSPEQACKAALQRVISKNPAMARDVQIGFLALNVKGEFGAYALQDGFTYSVRNGKEDKVYKAKHIY